MPELRRNQFVSTVVVNIPLCREHYRLVLQLDEFPATEPGQFIQLECRDGDRDYEPDRQWDWEPGDWEPGSRLGIADDELAEAVALLRRPFSLAGRRDTASGVELDIIHRIVGVGTDWLSRLKVGQRLHLLGPLGNRFQVPAEDGLAILVGGGVGIPPMLYLAEKLANRKCVAFCGALTRDLIPMTILDRDGASGQEAVTPSMMVEEFARHGIPSVITTDDGSYGFRGFVTQALELYLDSLSTQHSALGTAVIYTCGPEPMMKRVAEIAAYRGIECQIAVERAMACGMGTCQSCCIRVKKPDPAQPPLPGKEWCYRLACTDGPVFRGVDLLW
jgi:dihydroorotate dehydrogenase electron transfer subunit